jgi:hypothetical protein
LLPVSYNQFRAENNKTAGGLPAVSYLRFSLSSCEKEINQDRYVGQHWFALLIESQFVRC